MNAYYFKSLGDGLSGLALGERPDPEPGVGEVLIKIHARSVNFRDLRILAGLYPLPGRVGVVPLSDGAGEIVAVGKDVHRFAVGDRVVATYFPLWIDGRFSMQYAVSQFGCTMDGMLAPFVVTTEAALVKIPSYLSFEQASTLPCAALTAWCALNGPRPILPSETVLTIGTGGVALFALQFAKVLGARVIAITSSDTKKEFLHRLGADEVVNYKTVPDWEISVRQLTDSRGVSHVVETGALDTLPKSIACTEEEGVVSIVAALGHGNIDARVLANPVIIRRTYVGSRTSFEWMMKTMEEHQICPVVDTVLSFADSIEALRHFEDRRHIGKVVIAGS